MDLGKIGKRDLGTWDLGFWGIIRRGEFELFKTCKNLKIKHSLLIHSMTC